MSENTKNFVVLFTFLATVTCIAGIWLASFPLAAKFALTSTLFVVLTMGLILASVAGDDD